MKKLKRIILINKGTNNRAVVVRSIKGETEIFASSTRSNTRATAQQLSYILRVPVQEDSLLDIAEPFVEEEKINKFNIFENTMAETIIVIANSIGLVLVKARLKQMKIKFDDRITIVEGEVFLIDLEKGQLEFLHKKQTQIWV